MAVYTTIDDPSAHFQVAIYTGNGAANNAITNSGNSDLQPDLVWIKNRDATDDHLLFDSSRGATKHIIPDSSDDGETTDADTLDSFASDGFQVDADDKVNTNTEKYVAWQWKANGGSTSSNSNGGVTSTVQANTTAGFSIVQWTGDGDDETVGHGLGVAPDLGIVVNITDGTNWRIFQNIVPGRKMTDGNGYYMELDDDKSSSNPGSAVTWGGTPTAPTSTVFTVGTNNAHNGDGKSQLAYCFKSIQGYSKIGVYEGNRDDDGTFIWLGFKPAFVLLKDADDDVGYWFMFDHYRNSPGEGYENPLRLRLRAESNVADDESDDNAMDFLSNGFKLRTDNSTNGWDGISTYIYMAFAEEPFVTSEGVPCTAR